MQDAGRGGDTERGGAEGVWGVGGGADGSALIAATAVMLICVRPRGESGPIAAARRPSDDRPGSVRRRRSCEGTEQRHGSTQGADIATGMQLAS